MCQNAEDLRGVRLKRCSRAVATVRQAGFRTGLMGRKVTDAWREREAWCDASLLPKFRAKLFPACSLSACLLPWQRCLSLKCTLNGGGTGDGLHVHVYFDSGRMCACAAVPPLSAVLNYPILYFSDCVLWSELIFIEHMAELWMFPIRLFCLFDIVTLLQGKTIYSKKFFISRNDKKNPSVSSIMCCFHE